MDVIFQVVIRGRVQGIGFRAWTEITALELGVEGWVRNCRDDGCVEALLAGSEEVVLTMIELCRNGPPGAHVEMINQREASSRIWRCVVAASPYSERVERLLSRRPRSRIGSAGSGRIKS